MDRTLAITLLVAGALIILALAVYAGYLLRRLQRQRAREAHARSVIENAFNQERGKAVESIHIIARCILDGQVDHTEAAIRVAGLLDGLVVDEPVRERFSVFYQLREATEHIPRQDDWKALPAHERQAYQREMASLEDKFDDFIKAAARDLRDYEFDARVRL